MSRPVLLPTRRASLADVLILAGIAVLLACPVLAAEGPVSQEPPEQPTEKVQAAAVHSDAVVGDEEAATDKPTSQAASDVVERLQAIWEEHDKALGHADDAEYEELPDGPIQARVPVSLWSVTIARIGDDGRVELRSIEAGGVPVPEKRYQSPPPPLEVAEE